MHGIETLKKIVLFGIAMTAELDRTFRDGKFKLFEAFNFVDELKDLAELLPQLDQAAIEFKDLTTEEKFELVAFVKDHLKIERPNAEAITIAALALAAQLHSTLAVFKQVRDVA